MEDLPRDSACAYCRKLIEDGENPETRLEVYRDKTLALVVKNIGEGVKFAVRNSKFVKYYPSIENE